jgi:hypothetical protein
MNIGDLLDGAFTLYRKNFVTLVGIVAVATLPVLVIQLVAGLLLLPLEPFLTRPSTSGIPNFTSTEVGSLLLGGGFFLGASLLGALASIFETGALAIFIAEHYLGRQLNIQSAYRHALRRWTALLGMSLFIFLVYAALSLVVLIPFGLLLFATAASRSADLLGVVAICVPCILLPVIVLAFIVLSVRWQFAPQAIVIENRPPMDGLRRSWNLITGSFWRVAGINLVLTILVTIISSSATFSLQFAAALVPSVILVNVLNTLVTSALRMIVLPLQFATLTLLYYDLRVRKEGFDLQLLSEQLAAQPLTQPV